MAFIGLTHFENGTYYGPDNRVVDVLACWRGRLGSNPELVKLTQVAIVSPLMQPLHCVP